MIKRLRQSVLLLLSFFVIFFGRTPYVHSQLVGDTSFWEALLNGPGLYIETGMLTYLDQGLRDNSRNKVDDFPDLSLALNYFLFAYLFDKKIPGIQAYPGIIGSAAVLFPFEEGSSGLTDIAVGPIFGSDVFFNKKERPLGGYYISAGGIFPIGSYSSEEILTPGDNAYGVTINGNTTLFITPRLTFDLRVNYLWTAQHSEPNSDFFPGANTYQAGQFIYGNFALGYAVLPRQLVLGVNGYFLKQLNNDRLDGVEISDSKQEVYAITTVRLK